MDSSDKRFDVVRDFYNGKYYGHVEGRRGIPWHCRKMGAALGPMHDRNVLDVACGTGEWLEFFASRGAKVSGIDLSAKAIDECRKVFPESEFHCGPAEVLPFDDNVFDYVTCMGSLEHFLDKQGALREMVRVAKKNARFLLLVPNAGFMTRRLGLYGGTHQVAVVEDILPLDEWQKIFNEAGLRIVKRGRDLHPFSYSWITSAKPGYWPVRALQAFALLCWPVRWQYQVYHYCVAVESK